MNEESVTLTLTPDEAQYVVRALKARAIHWSHPDQIDRFEEAAGIRKTYRDLSLKVTAQIEECPT